MRTARRVQTEIRCRSERVSEGMEAPIPRMASALSTTLPRQMATPTDEPGPQSLPNHDATTTCNQESSISDQLGFQWRATVTAELLQNVEEARRRLACCLTRWPCCSTSMKRDGCLSLPDKWSLRDLRSLFWSLVVNRCCIHGSLAQITTNL